MHPLQKLYHVITPSFQFCRRQNFLHRHFAAGEDLPAACYLSQPPLTEVGGHLLPSYILSSAVRRRPCYSVTTDSSSNENTIGALQSPLVLPPPFQGTPLNEGGFYWNCRHIYHFSLAPLNEVDFIGAAVMLIILP